MKNTSITILFLISFCLSGCGPSPKEKIAKEQAERSKTIMGDGNQPMPVRGNKNYLSSEPQKGSK